MPPRNGFGTVCASLLALGAGGEVAWRFAPGPPGLARFEPVVVAAAAAAARIEGR